MADDTTHQSHEAADAEETDASPKDAEAATSPKRKTPSKKAPSTEPPAAPEGGERTVSQEETGGVVEVVDLSNLYDEATEPGSFPAPILLIIGLAGFASYALFKLVKLRIAERIKRWAPLAHVILWSIALFLCGAIAIQRASTEWMIFGLLVFGIAVLLNLNWLRSVLAGVALTLEHHLEVGDSVRIDSLEGDIQHFGLRATRIRALDGTVHDIPNDRLLTRNVANLSGDGSDSACQILISVPRHIHGAKAKEIALQSAILSPLSSPRHRPEVFLKEREHPDDPLRLHIRGYVFDPNYQDHFRSDVVTRVMEAFDTLSEGSAGVG